MQWTKSLIRTIDDPSYSCSNIYKQNILFCKKEKGPESSLFGISDLGLGFYHMFDSYIISPSFWPRLRLKKVILAGILEVPEKWYTLDSKSINKIIKCNERFDIKFSKLTPIH